MHIRWIQMKAVVIIMQNYGGGRSDEIMTKIAFQRELFLVLNGEKDT